MGLGGLSIFGRSNPSHPRAEQPNRSLPSIDAADELVRFFFSEFDVWHPILKRLRLSPDAVIRLAARAKDYGTDFQSELLASNLVSEEELFRAIAAEFGIGFIAELDPDRLVIKPEDKALLLRSCSKHVHVWMLGHDGRTYPLIAPAGMSLGSLKSILQRNGRLLPVLRFTTPRVLRQAILARSSRSLAEHARNRLHDQCPNLSAKIVATARQGVILGLGMAAIPLGFALDPSATLLAVHVFTSLFFLSCGALRFAAAASSPEPTPANLERTPANTLPVYSVLVALHNEVDVIPQLLAALEQIVWPRSKLEIKLVCEADDQQTLGAIAEFELPHHFEVVKVPPGLPRTKPKALNFALQLVKGDFVVLYDAEDRPHPLQLLEAWRRFQEEGEELACLQAPLEITNGASGVIPRMFAFEYSALFSGLLPWLSGRRVIIPLGGTSNHLKTSVLQQVGGWDPYNVTEDADLGLRLTRFGYRTATITLPTLEDAPETLSDWLPQRTRWLKGWLQTWLVHMRHPVQLLREIGPRSFLIAQILSAGFVVSAMLHPVLLLAGVYLVLEMVFTTPVSGWSVVLLTIDMLNLICGYASFLTLGWQTLPKAQRRGFWRVVLFTPPYWFLMSAAAWRSLFQIYRSPHHWEKTRHFRTKIG